MVGCKEKINQENEQKIAISSNIKVSSWHKRLTTVAFHHFLLQAENWNCDIWEENFYFIGSYYIIWRTIKDVMEEKSKLILVWNVDMGTVMIFTYTETFRRYGYGELFSKVVSIRKNSQDNTNHFTFKFTQMSSHKIFIENSPWKELDYATMEKKVPPIRDIHIPLGRCAII